VSPASRPPVPQHTPAHTLPLHLDSPSHNTTHPRVSCVGHLCALGELCWSSVCPRQQVHLGCVLLDRVGAWAGGGAQQPARGWHRTQAAHHRRRLAGVCMRDGTVQKRTEEGRSREAATVCCMCCPWAEACMHMFACRAATQS
jgi:hypothetical protein